MKTNPARGSSASALLTHEGARAFNINAFQQLRRSVMACMLFEDSFYESGEDIAARIHAGVAGVLAAGRFPGEGADWVANLAVEAREKFKLRHAPLWLILALARSKSAKDRAVVAGALVAAVQRADEMAEFLAMYWRTEDGKQKKTPLSNQVKKGLAAAFQKFSAHDLAKYAGKGNAISTRDVMFLVHPKPKDEAQAATWKELASGTLASADTWEVALSAGKDKKEEFTRLLSEGKLGALALLRNLRNMTEAKVDEKLIRAGLEKMKTERVLPFRFLTAARYAPQYEPELEQAMFRCLAGQPKLVGKTVLVVDHSGSMQSAVSGKSEISQLDAASALAILLREICDQAQVLVFSNAAKLVPARRGFALRDAIHAGVEWGGTNTQNAIADAARLGYDRVIVITDEQSHQTISHPVRGTKGYFVNVAAYQNGIGYGDWCHLDGWSEAILDWIQQYERANGEEK